MTDFRELDETLDFVASRLRSRGSLPRDPEAVEAAARFLTGNDRLSPVEQLDIYRVQFWLRHTSALLEDFPGLSGILGQTEWEKLAESYLTEVPPKSYSLRNLGDRLPGHVASRVELPHRELCLDMARLEWAYVEIFDAEDSPPLDAAELASVPEEAWQTARFRCSPALRLLRVGYPVANLRRTLRRAQRDGTNHPVEIPEPREQCLALYRGADRDLYFKVLSPAAFAVLERLVAGEALVPACENTAAAHPEFETEIENEVGTWFLDWGQRGFFSEVLLH